MSFDPSMLAHFPVANRLFRAVLDGTAEHVRARLKAGDNPNARSADGRTPLAHAVYAAHALQKSKALLAAGARIDVWDHFGMHPLHWAAGHSRYDVGCLALLLDQDASPNVAVRPLVDLQFHPVGWTALHIASCQAALPANILLINRGANVNQAAEDGSTPLHVAAGQWRVYKRLIRTLLDAGANLNETDSQGHTALHILAAGSGRYRKTVIQLLRHRGARLDLRDASGHLPLDLVPDSSPVSEAIRRILGGG